MGGNFGWKKENNPINHGHVRGLNCRDKRRLVKSMVFDWKADIYCFQETKLEGDITVLVNQI